MARVRSGIIPAPYRISQSENVPSPQVVEPVLFLFLSGLEELLSALKRGHPAAAKQVLDWHSRLEELRLREIRSRGAEERRRGEAERAAEAAARAEERSERLEEEVVRLEARWGRHRKLSRCYILYMSLQLGLGMVNG